MVHRIYNFSPGPAVLPEEVLQEARDNLLSLGGLGIGILEISHRSREFEAILGEATQNLRQLLGLPAGYQVLFLPGGATLQFSMVPMNLLPPGRTADYVVTGEWSKKALAEARRLGLVHVAATTEGEMFRRVPRNEELRLSDDPAYVHTTSNNTIYGTQWHWEPEVGGRLLVCDMSSDFLSRPIEIARYGLIYAGAQKNAGPAGVTVVILREELAQPRPDLPVLLSYRTHVEAGSLYNTPPVFAIYVVHLVLRWLLRQGGLAAMAEHNRKKAALIYEAIDAHPGFYRGHAQPDSRSLMNITFRLPTPELEDRFVREARAAGMDGLKGHRSVGGLRASVYNAFPLEGARALADFMHEFVRRAG
ncbi:MAG: 3-phosphoserine/phosphohydroxythreonine transaminase [Myxococcales bacterium]|nr:3-phosphoserine/phosphohydroxythreonine transaminase [Myxococcota bacterium]MDW8281354.1 3-phosphoserine/phosphohydroxythreonine transaminase [Myxococcales bacterium]